MSTEVRATRVPTRVLCNDQVDSTNAEAQRLIAQGAAAPFWVRADRQTGGRGRRGRRWSSPEGNFFGSLVVDAGTDPAQAALRSFVAALALAEAFDALGIAPDQTTLKWPNDVLLAGGKVAGILLETTRGPDGGALLIVGLGVNIAVAPDPADLEAHAVAPTTLAAHGARTSPAALLALIDAGFDHWHSRLIAEGFAPVRCAWLARAARLGTQITARLPGEAVTGRFDTLDPSGALMLDTAQGPRAITAADISF